MFAVDVKIFSWLINLLQNYISYFEKAKKKKNVIAWFNNIFIWFLSSFQILPSRVLTRLVRARESTFSCWFDNTTTFEICKKHTEHKFEQGSSMSTGTLNFLAKQDLTKGTVLFYKKRKPNNKKKLNFKYLKTELMKGGEQEGRNCSRLGNLWWALACSGRSKLCSINLLHGKQLLFFVVKNLCIFLVRLTFFQSKFFFSFWQRIQILDFFVTGLWISLLRPNIYS